MSHDAISLTERLVSTASDAGHTLHSYESRITELEASLETKDAELAALTEALELVVSDAEMFYVSAGANSALKQHLLTARLLLKDTSPRVREILATLQKLETKDAELAAVVEAAQVMVCPCTEGDPNIGVSELTWEDCTEGCPAYPLRLILKDTIKAEEHGR